MYQPATASTNHCCQELDLAELFSGCANLSKEFRGAGRDVAALDIKYSRGMDVCELSGFGSLSSHLLEANCLLWSCGFLFRASLASPRSFCVATLRGKHNSCLWLGVLCSSWVAVSRGSTKRSLCNADGWKEYRSVAQGNLMAARWAMHESIHCSTVWLDTS